MKKIDRALYREITAPSIIALLVLSFVVFTREFGRLAEMLIRKNADAITVFEVMVSLLPSILVFTLPMSFLIGVLIGFSRFSSDSEIVAMKANGIGLFQLVWPIFKVGIGVTAITLCFTFYLLPNGNWHLRQTRHEIGLKPVQSAIKPRVFDEDLPGKILYVEDIDLRTSSWRGVFLADTATAGEQQIILSREGRVMISPDGRRLQLHFENGSIYRVNKASPEKDSLSRFGTWDVPVRFPEIEVKEKPKRPEDKTIAELLRDLRQGAGEARQMSLAEFHSRISLPLSALIFAVLGVTLGINTHRGGRSYGFILSLIVAFVYYVLFATGTHLASKGILGILTGVWGADLLLAGVAAWTLRYAHSGSRALNAITNNRLLIQFLEGLQKLIGWLGGFYRKVFARVSSWLWSLSGLRLGIARVVDLYLMRTFFFYLALTLGVCTSLFYLFTFLELIDDMFARRAGYGLLLDYFLYLTPQILMLLVPLSILIGTLVTFGVLDKTNQVTAFKSCGVSLYRISLPVFTLALTIGAFLFVMQEYVLPYSNQRQDNLRNVIKGRPVQTYYQAGQKWIFGEDNRLYSYSYFDSEHNIFAELSVYQLDIGESHLHQRIYAQKAQWDREQQSWKLSNGWVRNFDGNSGAFAVFQQKDLPFAETPDYFAKEVKESSKMTYGELQEYIQELQQGGFEVDHLKTELYKKMAFPVVNVIMVVLGIPFAFSMGRKGALYGVAAGVLIGITYWGAFGLFGVLGVNGLLSPLLAAWGPNILFGAGGVLLLMTVRT